MRGTRELQEGRAECAVKDFSAPAVQRRRAQHLLGRRKEARCKRTASACRGTMERTGESAWSARRTNGVLEDRGSRGTLVRGTPVLLRGARERRIASAMVGTREEQEGLAACAKEALGARMG
jgi:hypothetical protein